MKGWKHESNRHALAARGIKTKKSEKKMDLKLPEWTMGVMDVLDSKMYEEMSELRTADAINDYIVKNEAKLAKNRNRKAGADWGDYLTCDEATDLMAMFLMKQNIPFTAMVGINDHGDSHSWIASGKKHYDPTGQGHHEGQRSWSWIPGVGETQYPTIDPEEGDKKEYWENVIYTD